MNRFRECREQAGLTQKYVAITLGVKPPSVSDWEKGKTSPTLENLMKLADLYGITADELLGRATPREARSLDGLQLDERQIVTLYRQLNDEGKEYVFKTLLMAQSAMRKAPAGDDAPRGLGP